MTPIEPNEPTRETEPRPQDPPTAEPSGEAKPEAPQPQPASQPATSAGPSTKPPKQLSTTALVVIGSAIVLALFALQIWSSGNNVRHARRQGVLRCTESLAASFRQYLLDRNPERTRRALVDVAQAGKFEEVTLTDAAGNVLASTDRSKELKSIRLPRTPAIRPDVTFQGGRMSVVKAVVVGGDNVLGNLRIVARDGE